PPPRPAPPAATVQPKLLRGSTPGAPRASTPGAPRASTPGAPPAPRRSTPAARPASSPRPRPAPASAAAYPAAAAYPTPAYPSGSTGNPYATPPAANQGPGGYAVAEGETPHVSSINLNRKSLKKDA